jgi:hypothetical protein
MKPLTQKQAFLLSVAADGRGDGDPKHFGTLAGFPGDGLGDGGWYGDGLGGGWGDGRGAGEDHCCRCDHRHSGIGHLKRYLAEFDFRYNEREGLGVDDAERVAKSIPGIVGKRLAYRRTDKEGQPVGAKVSRPEAQEALRRFLRF